MATFAVEVEEGKADKFMQDTNERLQKDSLVNNPFYGKVVKLQSEKGYDYYLLHMKPIWPRVYLFGIVLILIPASFLGLSLWLLPGIAILASGFFWSKRFFFIVLKKGLKKQGYKGKVRLLEYDNMMQKCVDMLSVA